MENKKVKKENSIIKITINKIKEENKEKINDNTIKRTYNELIEIVNIIFKDKFLVFGNIDIIKEKHVII